MSFSRRARARAPWLCAALRARNRRTQHQDPARLATLRCALRRRQLRVLCRTAAATACMPQGNNSALCRKYSPQWRTGLPSARIPQHPPSISAVSFEGEKAAKEEQNNCSDNQKPLVLPHIRGHRGKLCGEEQSGKATYYGKPAKYGDKHRPVRPDIVAAHNRKTCDKQENAGEKDERNVMRDLLHHDREGAKIKQHANYHREQRGSHQTCNRFRHGSPLKS